MDDSLYGKCVRLFYRPAAIRNGTSRRNKQGNIFKHQRRAHLDNTLHRNSMRHFSKPDGRRKGTACKHRQRPVLLNKQWKKLDKKKIIILPQRQNVQPLQNQSLYNDLILRCWSCAYFLWYACTKNAPRLHQSRVLGRQRSASSPRFQQGF